MNIHVVLKFYYEQVISDTEQVNTINAHFDVIKKTGKVFWGARSSMSQSKVEQINNQIAEGIPTYAFLYATKVSKKVHPDGNLWYIAELERIHPGTPNNRHHTPS